MWRAIWVAIKLSFLTFILAVIIFATVYWDRKKSRVFNWCMNWWSDGWLRAAGVKPQIIGQELLEPLKGRSFWLVGNHQSALDIPILGLACQGRVRFMAKKELFSIPVVGTIMHLHGFTPVDRSDIRKSKPELEKMLKRLQSGTCAQVVFPEGTRTVTGEMLPFKHGSFRLIEETQLPVVPFVIDGSWKVQHKSSLKIIPGPITLRFCEPIMPNPEQPLTRDDLLQQVRTECVKRLAEGRGEIVEKPTS